eukprot:PITA_27170
MEFKDRLCTTPILTLPDLQQPFEVKIDSSDYAIGAVLTQHKHPVAYHSETLSNTVQKYPTYDKEMYSIVQACRQWKHYILGKETCRNSHCRSPDCLSQLPIMVLTIVLNSCGYEISDWPLLYKSEPEFGHTYQTLLEGQHVPDFHLRDAMLCHLGHLCVPSSERDKMIWEAHYSWAAGNFGVEKMVAVL